MNFSVGALVELFFQQYKIVLKGNLNRQKKCFKIHFSTALKRELFLEGLFNAHFFSKCDSLGAI